VFLDPSLGWAPYAAGGIEVIDIPGTHFTMFGDPGVQRIGEAISATLTEIEPSALSVTGSK
jgi:thioesterase domain-containing protein